MKKFFFLIFMILFFGCREDAVQYSLEQSTADVYVNSFPREAEIFLNNNFTGKTTPDTLKYLDPGTYLLTLRLDGFRDSTVSLHVEAMDKKSVYISLEAK
jgi:hypothetical protein